MIAGTMTLLSKVLLSHGTIFSEKHKITPIGHLCAKRTSQRVTNPSYCILNIYAFRTIVQNDESYKQSWSGTTRSSWGSQLQWLAISTLPGLCINW